STQVHPESAPKIGANNECASTRMPETTQYSGCMIALPTAINGSQMLSGISIGRMSSISSHLVVTPGQRRLTAQGLGADGPFCLTEASDRASPRRIPGCRVRDRTHL